MLDTFWDDYSNCATPARAATMRVADNLLDIDLKEDPPEDLDYKEMTLWKYRRYLQDYLRCVAAVDENVGRACDYVAERGERARTITLYGSDQGFFLGEHGWFDKRFMYEESLRMPLVMSWPERVPAGQVIKDMTSNVDIAQTLLEAAGVPAPDRMQGISLLPRITGLSEQEVRDAFYYRYYEHDDNMHHVWAHYGLTTQRYKLIYYYADGMGLPNASGGTYPPEWELFDLQSDPHELKSVYHDSAYCDIREQLKIRLLELQRELGDKPYERPTPAQRAEFMGKR